MENLEVCSSCPLFPASGGVAMGISAACKPFSTVGKSSHVEILFEEMGFIWSSSRNANENVCLSPQPPHQVCLFICKGELNGPKIRSISNCLGSTDTRAPKWEEEDEKLCNQCMACSLELWHSLEGHWSRFPLILNSPFPLQGILPIFLSVLSYLVTQAAWCPFSKDVHSGLLF